MANELETRKKLLEYLMLLNSQSAEKGAGEEYVDYVDTVTKLNDNIANYYRKDENGKYPQMSADEVKNLVLLYENVIKKGEILRGKQSPNSGDRYRFSISEIVEDFLKKDLEVLAKISPEDKKTLPEQIAGARIKSVDLSEVELKKVEAGTSVRMPFTYTDESGTEISGYFTEKTTFESSDVLLKDDEEYLREKYANENHPEMAEFAIAFQKENNENGIGQCFGKPGDAILPAHRVKIKNYYKSMKQAGQYSEPAIEKYSEEELNRLVECMREYGQRIDSKFNDWVFRSTYLSSKPGDVKDARNSAMSIVANLLGVGDIIAHSEPMKIKLKDREVEGTFMRTAEGKDISNITEDDPFNAVTYEQLNQTKPKKQITELTILDYICGNIDRHTGNIFYQTDESGNLTGIIGIDNDMSFPARLVDDPKKSLRSGIDVPLDNITAVSAEMAECLLSMTPDILEVSLRGTGLNDDEIKTTTERLKNVQQRIVNDIEYYKDKEEGRTEEGHIRIINDFSKISLKELAMRSDSKNRIRLDPDSENPLDVMVSHTGRLYDMTSHKWQCVSKEQFAQRRELPKGSEIMLHKEKEEERLSVRSYKQSVTILREGLELADPWNVHSSVEFKAMKACLKELDNQLKSMPEDNPDNASVSRLRNTYADLVRLSSKYIEKKNKEKNPSQTAQWRMDMANRVLRVAQSHFDNFDDLVLGQIKELSVSKEEESGIGLDGIVVPNQLQEPYIEAFTDLKNNMEPFMTLDANTLKHQSLDANDIEELKNGHETTLQKIEEYLNAHEKDPDFVQKSELAYKIQKNVLRDYMSLKAAKPGDTLYDVISNGNGRIVDVTGHTAKTQGNVLSTRRMLNITGSDGKIVKGFFTERSYIGQEARDRIIRKLAERFPAYQKEIREYYDIYNSDLSLRKKQLVYDVILENHKDDPEFAKAYAVYTKAIEKTERQNITYMMIADTTSSPIDTRNTAMSDIANLLGIGDVIAPSTEMKLKDGNNIIEGTFMYNAEGEDFAHIKKDSSFQKCKEGWMDYSPALRQMADLNVLDYICMNVDRHNKNIFYRFDKSNPDNPKLIGITGIDNDMSFAPVSQEYGMIDSSAHHSGIEGITCISDKLAEAVMNLKPAMIKNVLELRGLTKAHVEGALIRLEKLQKQLAEGRIPQYTEEEFMKHKASDFMQNNGSDVHNVFASVAKVTVTVKSEYIEKDSPDRNIDVVNLYEKGDNLMVSQDNELLDELKLDLHQATIGVHGGSEEFTNVCGAIDKIAKANAIMSTNANQVTQPNIAGLSQMYGKAVVCCKAYLERKNKQNKYFAPNTKDGRRIQAVRKVMDFCWNRMNCLEGIVQRKNMNKDNEHVIVNDVIRENEILNT